MPHKTLEARREYQRRWRKDNAPAYAASQETYKQSGKKNWAYLLRIFGITKEQYEEMERKRLSVDHNHETQKIRALLCSNCNSALGLLKECPIRMLRLLQYIRRFSQ